MDKFLYYPLKPVSVNQKFGENANSYYASAGMKGHSGIDFQAVHGQPIYASHDGVCMPQVDDHGGNGVVIISNDSKYKTLAWHLIDDNAVVQTGQKVKAGDLIGYADNTGQSTGDHLHFGLCFFPQDFGNGYKGFTDPQPYFNGIYASDINNPPLPTPTFKFTLTTRYGSWNNDVKQMQIVLKGLNLYGKELDGIFGPATLGAVKEFQNQHGLIADGVVGLLSRAELNKFL